MQFDIVKKINFEKSFRNQSIVGMFDLQDENYTEKFSGSIDLNDKKWIIWLAYIWNIRDNVLLCKVCKSKPFGVM